MEANEVVKKYLTKDGKILQYPSKKTIRPYILSYIASQFEEGKKYTEKEVNQIIREHIDFSDHELIRRELFMYHFMDRYRDGSQYWREVPGPELPVL